MYPLHFLVRVMSFTYFFGLPSLMMMMAKKRPLGEPEELLAGNCLHTRSQTTTNATPRIMFNSQTLENENAGLEHTFPRTLHMGGKKCTFPVMEGVVQGLLGLPCASSKCFSLANQFASAGKTCIAKS